MPIAAQREAPNSADLLARLWRPEAALAPAAAALVLLGTPHLAGLTLDSSSGPSWPHAAAPHGDKARQQQPPATSTAAAPGLLPQPRDMQQRHEQGGGSSLPSLDLNHDFFIALAVCMAAAALANSAGVGGGAFIVPLFYTVLHLPIKDATALSQAAITGGALGAVLCSYGQRHPSDGRRPLIDYELALITTPTLLLGCTSGVLVNQLLPNWAVTLLLSPLLLALTWHTAATATRMFREESHAQRRAGTSDAAGGLLEQPLAAAAAAAPAECPTAWMRAVQMAAMWAVLLAFQVGKHSAQPCTPAFAALYAGQVGAGLATSAYFIWQAVGCREQQARDGGDRGCGRGGGPLLPLPLTADGDASEGLATGPADAAAPGWQAAHLVSASSIALAGGVVAGTTGIGELGMHPQAAAATTTAVVLFSSSSAAASFALEGRLDPGYAAAFFAACAVAAVAGVGCAGATVRKSGRASLVVALLAALIGSGALMTVACSGAEAVAELASGRAEGLASVCGTG
eukprot:scaffold7.g3711.t1